MFLNCLHVASVLSQKNIYSSLLILVKLHVCFLLNNFASSKKCYLQKNENETPTCRKAIFSEKSRDRALFMWSFVNLYDSLKDAQIWVREIMIIFAFSNIDNYSTTVQWMVTNDTDAREVRNYYA